jgi:LysM repeat protein
MHLKSLLLFLCAGSSLFANIERVKPDRRWEEIQADIEDLKHSLHGTQIDLNLLEGKVKNHPSKDKGQTELLERRLSSLEKRQDKIAADLQLLSSHINDLAKTFSKEKENAFKDVEEISKLKETLTLLLKTMRTQSLEAPSKPDVKTYKVKQGDSLERIARLHHSSVEAIKKANHLTDDRIIIGQELRVANE